jgi:hypothetical protein
MPRTTAQTPNRAEQLVEILTNAKGPVERTELMEQLQVSDSQLRQLMHEARRKGRIIKNTRPGGVSHYQMEAARRGRSKKAPAPARKRRQRRSAAAKAVKLPALGAAGVLGVGGRRSARPRPLGAQPFGGRRVVLLRPRQRHRTPGCAHQHSRRVTSAHTRSKPPNVSSAGTAPALCGGLPLSDMIKV